MAFLYTHTVFVRWEYKVRNFSKKKVLKLDFQIWKVCVYLIFIPGIEDFKSAGSVGLVAGF